jgi:hypothetical protein
MVTEQELKLQKHLERRLASLLEEFEHWYGRPVTMATLAPLRSFCFAALLAMTTLSLRAQRSNGDAFECGQIFGRHLIEQSRQCGTPKCEYPPKRTPAWTMTAAAKRCLDREKKNQLLSRAAF